MQATPSPRPTKPIDSFVFPLMLRLHARSRARPRPAAHGIPVRRDLRRLRDDDDVYLRDAPALRCETLVRERQHLDGITAGVRGIRIGEHLSDVAERRGTEYGVSNGVTDASPSE